MPLDDEAGSEEESTLVFQDFIVSPEFNKLQKKEMLKIYKLYFIVFFSNVKSKYSAMSFCSSRDGYYISHQHLCPPFLVWEKRFCPGGRNWAGGWLLLRG